MCPRVCEALELDLRVAIATDAPECLAVPERDVARERWRDRAPAEIRPRALGVFEAPEAVEREPEAVTRPPIERRRHCRAREAREHVVRAPVILHAQRRPSAAGERPDRQGLPRLLRDLSEETVRL